MNGGNVLAFMANHVWQSTVFGMLAAGLAFMLRANHARVRYWLWVTASIKFLVPFAVFASIGSYAHWVKPVALTPPATVVTLMQWNEPFSATMPGDAFDVPSKTVRLPQKSTSAWPTGLIILWLSGGLFVAASSYSRWRRFATVVHAARPIPAGREADVLQRVQQEFRLSSPIRLVTSESMIEPGLFGIMAPILLLPIGLRDRITDLQLEAIFAHELCHARRRDNLWAAVHMAVEALFWFHPGVWWLGSRLIEERELSCDEEVLRCGCAPDVYAKAMVEICKSYLAAPVKCISGVTGSDLRRRIEVVMKNGIAQRLAVGKRLLIVTFGTVAVCGPIAIGFLNVQQNKAQFLSAGLSTATLVRGETSQQTGTAV